jgi:hypothetical protein
MKNICGLVLIYAGLYSAVITFQQFLKKKLQIWRLNLKTLEIHCLLN